MQRMRQVLGMLPPNVPRWVPESWSACAITFSLVGQFKYPAVQRYIHDLISETGEHIDRITDTLRMFIEVGRFFIHSILL